jgi:hypothetical protein
VKRVVKKERSQRELTVVVKIPHNDVNNNMTCTIDMSHFL